MKIRLLSPTNIRLDPSELAIPPIGVLHAGAELEVDNRLYRGAPIDGVDTFFRDANGWYYWSGRTVVLYKALPSPRPEPSGSVEEIGGSWQLPVSPASVPAAGAAVEPDPWPAQENSRDEAERSRVPAQAEIPDPTAEAPTPAVIGFSPAEPQADEQDRSLDLAAEPSWTSPALHLKNWAQDTFQIAPLYWDGAGAWGQEVRLMILSSGVDVEHPDLQENLVEALNFCAPGQAVIDTDGLGSATAGIAAGSGRAEWLGVAPRAQVLVGKIMDNAFGFSYSRLMDALSWAAARAPHILLFGFDFRADSIHAGQRMEIQYHVQQLAKAGTLCMGPVGEGTSSRPEDRWPACLESCLSVGAVDHRFQRMSTSLRSYRLGVMAPGEGLGPRPLSLAPTVQAAAFAAGTAAAAMSWAQAQQISMDSSAWIALLKETAIPQHSITKCRDMEYGCGRIAPGALLEALAKKQGLLV